MRRVLVDHHHRVAFFWSPKCASRSLADWIFVELMGGRRKTELETQGKAEPEHGGPKGPHKKREFRSGSMVNKVYGTDFATAAALIRSHGYLGVAFVRHPARRVASAYLNKLVTHRAGFGNGFEGLEFFAREAVSSVYEATDRSVETQPFDGISMMELLDFIEDKAGLARKGDKLNAHWNYQVHRDLLNSGLRFDHVCTVETLEEDFRPIQALFGSDLPIGERNTTRTSHGTPVASDADLSAVPSMTLLGQAVTAANLLHRPVLERIASIYAPDYEFLGYDPFDLNAPPAIKAGNREQYRHQTLAQAMRGKAGIKRSGGLGGFFRRLSG